jgi:hypothetical protein
MIFGPCSREKEITEALRNGHWPEACDAELRAHANACRSCSDFVLITQTFERTRIESAKEAGLASPGLLWWRAQLRRRNAALERIARPIAVARIFAWVTTLLVTLGFVVWEYGRGAEWLSWRAELPQFSSFPDWNLVLLIPSLAVLALLSGVALYLASERQ